MSFVWAAIGLGFVSSFHCLGMCGPIALALPIGPVSPFKKILYILLYNAGRIYTYTILGALFGLIGSTLMVGSFQSTISITIGLFLLVSVFFSNHTLQNSLNTSMFWFFTRIKKKLSDLFSNKNKNSVFLIGLLNGLLPCGMVYLAIAGALTSGSIINSMLFMVFFGVGTLTIMLTLPLFGNLIGNHFRKLMQKISPLVKVGMATLLILRGLNLGIPYISPELNNPNKVLCHDEQSISTQHPSILCSKPKN